MNPDSLSHPMSVLHVTEALKAPLWWKWSWTLNPIYCWVLLTSHFIQSLDEAPKGNTETLMEAVHVTEVRVRGWSGADWALTVRGWLGAGAGAGVSDQVSQTRPRSALRAEFCAQVPLGFSDQSRLQLNNFSPFGDKRLYLFSEIIDSIYVV